MGGALACTLTDVLADVLLDVFVGVTGGWVLGGIRAVAVEGDLVPSLSVARIGAAKSRRAVPIPCRLRVAVNLWEDAASPPRRLTLSFPPSASLRLSWNELAAVCAVARDLPSLAIGESSDRLVSSVVIKMASASRMANARCSPNVYCFRAWELRGTTNLI
jgi:hypothetical protein